MKVIETEVKILAHKSYERHGKTVDVKKIRESTDFYDSRIHNNKNGYRDGMVDRYNGKRASYYSPINTDNAKKMRSDDGWLTQRGKNNRHRGGGRGSQLPRPPPGGVYDYYEDNGKVGNASTGISTQNSYAVLRKDLHTSDTD